ncbi:MAG: hypothetical protein GXP47_07595 [Acidobacteria bacterium]|nr:hypothetical protein [Acidobacteriota bacterium]
MAKRTRGKKRRATRRPAGERPAKRPTRYSKGELVLAALGALLVLFFVSMVISSLL